MGRFSRNFVYFFCQNTINDLSRSVMFCFEKFCIFAKTFAKIFAKVFVIFVYFCLDIFAKTKINFRENFRENAKTKIFVSTLFDDIS
jgi:hypothetical protein